MSKELLSKFTFGFLMAQFFPGAVAVFAVALAADSYAADEQSPGLWPAACSLYGHMLETPSRIAIYAFLAAGTGMLIHGLHWTVLAWLENHGNSGKPRPSRESFWHRRCILFQLVFGPIKMVIETLWLLVAPNLKSLAMEENVPRVRPARMPNFIFLEEFYLYFGQFYAHTAYALLLSMGCLVVALFRVGWTVNGGLLIAGTYLGTSIFFLLGRVQLATLFIAERALCDQSDPSNGGTQTATTRTVENE